MVIEYRPKGICPRTITVDVQDGIIKDIDFYGGCDGNHKGLKALVKGQDASKVAEQLKGITCGFRSTSCPDQLSKALEIALAEEAK